LNREFGRVGILLILVAILIPTTVPISLAAQVASASQSKRIVGYLTDNRLDQLNKIELGKVTNVVYFALTSDSNGNLTAGSTYIKGLPTVISTAHANGIKVSVCVSPKSDFSPMANSQIARSNFIGQLVSFAHKYDLDGVDLDWESVADADVPNYSTLVKELKTSLSPYGLLLSLASRPAHQDIQPWAADYLDFISVMAYDMNHPHANHSTYSDSVAAMTRWASYGVAKSKLLMGIPFYGRNEGWTSSKTYAEIVNQYNLTDPNMDCIAKYCFNGINTVESKTAYAYDAGYGGVMIWELGQDKYDSRSLLTAIASVPTTMSTSSSTAITSVPTPTTSTNSSTTNTALTREILAFPLEFVLAGFVAGVALLILRHRSRQRS
jgi:chitinase